jgi:hypothetical protein
VGGRAACFGVRLAVAPGEVAVADLDFDVFGRSDTASWVPHVDRAALYFVALRLASGAPVVCGERFGAGGAGRPGLRAGFVLMGMR